MQSGRRGFTLIELLVVIAIIAIMAAILFPVFARAKESGRRAQCASNIKQLNTALLRYVDDYNGKFMRVSWTCRVLDIVINNKSQGPYAQDCLYEYVRSSSVWLCPSLKPNMKLPDFGSGENYSAYTWADNRGTLLKTRRAASNYMWNSVRPSPRGIVEVSGSSVSEIVRPTKATMWFELPYWGDPPHLSTEGSKLRGKLMGGNIGFYDGHVAFIKHDYENMWVQMGNQGWSH